MTKEQFLEKYLNKAVWCKTEELANEFLKMCDEFGIWKPLSETKLLDYYSVFSENTCYIVDVDVDGNPYRLGYCSKKYFIDEGISIIEFEPPMDKVELIPLTLKEIIFEKLGVKPNEVFKVNSESKYFPYEKYMIRDDLCVFGLEEGTPAFANVTFPDMATFINEPELIKKLPPKSLLTEEETEFLKFFKNIEYVKRLLWFLEIKYLDGNVRQIKIGSMDKEISLTFFGLIPEKEYTPKELGL